MKYLRIFETDGEYQSYVGGGGDDYVTPHVALIKDNYDVKYQKYEPDYTNDYLTIEALEDDLSVSFSRNIIQYSTDNCQTWIELPADTVTPAINAGDMISFKATGLTSNGRDGIGTFRVDKKFNLKGNVMSMLFGDEGYNNYSLTGYDYAFYKLFYYCSTLQSISKDFLPATILTPHCYNSMFYDCTSLTQAPELPATTLANGCYFYMFTSCTSLVNAPELPATTLVDYCYNGMFYGCTSLTQAPELPATTLANGCYYIMFAGCTSLNYIKMLATDISAKSCLTNWVSEVSSTGTFIKNSDATWDVTGANIIPKGWNTIEYPCVSPAIVNISSDNDNNVTFYLDNDFYTPTKEPISLLSIFDYSQIMQLTPECDIEVCILSEGTLVESSYKWKHSMSLNDVINDLNLYYEDITIVITNVIIESNDDGYYSYYYY